MKPIRRPAAALAVWLLVALGRWSTAPAVADERLEALKALHDRLAGAREAIAVDEARKALEELKKLDLRAEQLASEPRTWMNRALVAASLAAGDAGAAPEALAALERDAGGTRETLRAAWEVAVATGDAERGARTLEALEKARLAPTATLEARRKRLELVGAPAPGVIVEASDGARLDLRLRQGVVLVLDLWSTTDRPKERQLESIRRLNAEFATDPRLRLLGINSDPPTSADAAEALARELKLDWPQHYERSVDAPLTRGAFKVDAPPLQVLIDGEGLVRAVGLASEPEFVYAVRAAVAQAKGQHPVIRPRTIAGLAASPPAGTRGGGPDVADKPGEATKDTPQVQPDLPSIPEARDLLDRARLYLKTGKKTEAQKLLRELIEKYPHSREAKEARDMGLV